MINIYIYIFTILYIKKHEMNDNNENDCYLRRENN